MKRFYFLFLICLIAISTVHAQEMGKRFRYQHLEGTINNNLNIKMDLMNNYDGFRGTYYYPKHGGLLYLESVKGKEGILTLKETTRDGEKTGTFEGKWNGTELNGTWTSADGKKSYPFHLEETYNNGSVMFMPYSIFDKQKLKGVDGEAPEASYKVYYLHPLNYKSISQYKRYRDSTAYNFFGKQSSYDDPTAFLEAASKKYFDEYQSISEDYDGEMGYAYNWEEQMEQSVILNEQGVVCTSVNWYAYSGGAHGNFSTVFMTYDLESGSYVKLNDLFMPGFEQPISRILDKQIREMNNIPDDQTLTDGGMFVEQMLPTENFYISRSGIYFYYNVYEIAPYAGGPTELYVPFSEISTLLKPKSILTRLGAN